MLRMASRQTAILMPAVLAALTCGAWAETDGDCGPLITAPGAFSGDTCLDADDCALRPSRDARLEITLPVDGFTGVDCGATYETAIECVPLGPSCPADVNSDGVVNVPDLLEVLAAWGPCS